MGMFRKRNKASSDGRDQTVDTDTENDTNDESQSTPPMNEELEEKLHEVMMDNLEMMRDLVFRIRDDPEFAKGIYKECPRLQHLLNRYPDLRPIFEDPKLVRINFETVYRNAGGILPEDEVDKKKKSWLIWFVNSPIFKVLKLLLFVKKLMACIAGGGIAMITGCFVGCCFEDALDEIGGDDGDFDADDADDDYGNDPGKEALNRAADHMEDPDVQEQMEALMEDPDNMEEAIANDSELQALRESNALCDELMNDPETMKVLTDPDNLRALGEAPNLIEADFVDPDSFMPEDIETGGFESGDGAFDGLDSGGDAEFGDTDADFEYEVDGDGDDGFDGETEIEAEADGDGDGDVEGDGEAEAEGEGEEDGFDDGGEEEEDGWWDDAELEEQDNPDADANTANKGKAAANKKSGAAASAAGEAGKGGGYRGIMASVGVAATELIAAQVVGQVFDVAGMGALMGGGGGGLDGLDDIGDGLDDAVNDDVADAAEDAVDETDEQADEAKENSKSSGMDADLDDAEDDGKKRNAGAIAGGAAGGAAIGGGAGYAMSGSGDGAEDNEGEDTFDDEEEGSEEEEKKKSRFGFIGSFASTLATAAKEHVATALLGDDFGEALVERWEERGDDDSKEEKGDGEDGDGEPEEDTPKKRGFFRRNK